jgi:hypothetical protein
MKTRALLICVLAVAGVAGVAGVVGVAAAAGPSDERARITRQRHALETRFAEQEAECRTRFSVTACIDDVKARRRDSMNVLREQELQLDDAERKQRTAQRLQALEAKRLEMLARPPVAPPAPVTRVVPRAVPEPRETRRPRDTAAEAEAAARRASAAEAQRDEAAEDRAKIAAREAARAAKPKKSAPLPLPPEIAGSGSRR